MLCPPITVHPASIIFDKPAGQNALQEFPSLAFSGKHTRASEVSGLPAHGINIAQCIGRRDLSKRIRIVHDRREEIHRLHQRLICGASQIHSGVVGMIEADQNIRVMLPG
jgi:hypothetical protein